jgi:hypothetical protein
MHNLIILMWICIAVAFLFAGIKKVGILSKKITDEKQFILDQSTYKCTKTNELKASVKNE